MSFTINLSITTLVVKHLGGWRNLAALRAKQTFRLISSMTSASSTLLSSVAAVTTSFQVVEELFSE